MRSSTIAILSLLLGTLAIAAEPAAHYLPNVPSYRLAANARTADGKWMQVYEAFDSYPNLPLRVSRLNDDYSVDSTFAPLVLPHSPGSSDIASSIFSLPDGATLVVGSQKHLNSETGEGFLVRIAADGKLDSSFGDGGLAAVASDFGVQETVLAAGMLKDGSLRLAVIAEKGGQLTIKVLGVTPQGTLDPNYGKSGVAQFPQGSSVRFSAAFLIDGDGSATGAFTPLPGDEVVLESLDSRGQAVTSFGQGGLVRTGLRGAQGLSLAADSDGKIVVAAAAGGGQKPREILVAVFNNQGLWNTQFRPLGSPLAIPDVFFYNDYRNAEYRGALTGSGGHIFLAAIPAQASYIFPNRLNVFDIAPDGSWKALGGNASSPSMSFGQMSGYPLAFEIDSRKNRIFVTETFQTPGNVGHVVEF